MDGGRQGLVSVKVAGPIVQEVRQMVKCHGMRLLEGETRVKTECSCGRN